MLLGAISMCKHVPFHRVDEQPFAEPIERFLVDARERLLQARDSILGYYGPPDDTLSFALSDEERTTWHDVLNVCLEECGDSANDLSVHLYADSREEVVALLQKLKQSN